MFWKNFMAPFNCLTTTELLQGDSLRFTIKSPGVPGTHKGWVNRKATLRIWTRDLGLGIQRRNQ